jgi:hypothetical protein
MDQQEELVQQPNPRQIITVVNRPKNDLNPECTSKELWREMFGSQLFP